MANIEIIKTINIHKRYTMGDQIVKALDGVNLSIPKGDFVAIMGSSGSGKSTLLNILGCLDLPTEGDYILDGINVKNLNKNQLAEIRNQKLGFVFQSYNLLPRTTALENIELPLLYNPAVSKSERKDRAEQALIAVGLKDRMKHLSNQMSGGQQQRVAIARSLVTNPVVILADEATGNLDTRTSYDIMDLFQKLNGEGMTICFVTHEPDIAAFTKRNVVFQDGKIIEDRINPDIRNVTEALTKYSEENKNYKTGS
jgi:putative ABC transport system ATP-binding protein